jgi:hypothetical protein
MARKMSVGDKVKFKADFLRSIQWYTDVPTFGTIIQVTPFAHNRVLYKVQWNDTEMSDAPTNVLDLNLIPFRKAD